MGKKSFLSVVLFSFLSCLIIPVVTVLASLVIAFVMVSCLAGESLEKIVKAFPKFKQIQTQGGPIKGFWQNMIFYLLFLVILTLYPILTVLVAFRVGFTLVRELSDNIELANKYPSLLKKGLLFFG